MGLALVTLSLSTLFVLVPAPRWAVAEELDVHSEPLALQRRRADRSDDPLAVAGLDAAEVTERRSALASQGRRASGVRHAEVRAIGVTVPSLPDGPILARARVDGAWTPWLEVPFADGEAPDRGEVQAAGIHSEPMWLGEADAYEIDAPATTATLEVHTIRPSGTLRTSVPAGVAGAATPSIRSRASWGAAPPDEPPTTTLDLKLAIVHHTVTGNTYSASQVPSVLRSIQAYHQDVRGYNDIAYNVLVDRFGIAWEGRAGGLSNVVLGGHSQGFNTGSVGVSVIGDYTSVTPSGAVLETIARVIAWKMAIHDVDPRSTVPYTSAGSAKYAAGTTVTLRRVVAHRDVQSTACPGASLYSRLPWIRARVNELWPSYQSGRLPKLLDLDANGDGLRDPFEYRAGGGSDVQWRAQASGTFAKSSQPVGGTYRPATGDFDGDGRDDILWHGSGSSRDYLWWSTASGGHTVGDVSVGGSYVPVVGDFNGNGADEVFWYGTGPAADAVWRWSGRVRQSTSARQGLITAVPLAGDFDGDGRDDIFFYAPGPDADDEMWWSQGQTWSVVKMPVAGFYRPVVHDTNGDGRDDITWYRPSGTSSPRWQFPAGRTVSSQLLSHPGFAPAQPVAGDFDGDGRSDVLLVGAGSRHDEVWYSTSGGIARRGARVDGTFAMVGGPMDGPPLLPIADPDDVLFVRNGSDWAYYGRADRTFSPAQVG